MAKLIKQSISLNNDLAVEIYDKTDKDNVDYNYLVEVSNNGRSTMLSKFFEDLKSAETYFSEIELKGNFLNTIDKL
jgi:hypothetical protein